MRRPDAWKNIAALVPAMAVAGWLLALSGCVIAPSAPVTTPDGLEKRSNVPADSVYAAPGVSLARYRRVMLDDVDVAFKPDWQLRHPEISAGEISDIRKLAASLWRASFSSELSKGGYELVSTPAADVLRVSATIVDVDFAASSAGPAAGGVGGGSYMVSVADISLLADLRDSLSGAIIARVADRKSGRNYGNLKMASEANPSAEAVQAFSSWAARLREAMDAARKPLEARP
jgi:Protein of unknown function (DUF3313)